MFLWGMQFRAVSLVIFFIIQSQCADCQSKNNENQVSGTFWSPDKDGRIAVYEKHGKYFGKSIWGIKPGKDVKNPNPALRNREVIGLEFLSDFVYNANDQEFQDGKIYDPRTGKTYDCKMWLGKDDNLRVRGYLGIPMLGMTVIFERIDHKKHEPNSRPEPSSP